MTSSNNNNSNIDQCFTLTLETNGVEMTFDNESVSTEYRGVMSHLHDISYLDQGYSAQVIKQNCNSKYVDQHSNV